MRDDEVDKVDDLTLSRFAQFPRLHIFLLHIKCQAHESERFARCAETLWVTLFPDLPQRFVGALPELFEIYMDHRIALPSDLILDPKSAKYRSIAFKDFFQSTHQQRLAETTRAR